MSDTEVKEVEAVEAETVEEALDSKGDPSAPTRKAVPAEPSPLKNDAEDLGSAVTSPSDERKGPSNAGNKSKKVEDQVNKDANDGSNPAGKGDFKPGNGMKEEEVESEDEVVAEETEEEEVIDLSKDVEALVSADADLSEEFKEKAATIFETAVKTRLAEKEKKMKAKMEDEMEEKISAVKEELVEKVDSYLNYVVEEWVKDNELAVESGIRSEIAEDFISGLKNLFKEHYIDVPEEKFDVLESMAKEKEELEKKLNEEMAKNVELSKSNSVFSKEKIFSEASEGLADTETEKLKELAENIEFKDEQDFSKKLDTIKESYFPKAKSEPTESKEDVDSVVGDANLTTGSNEAMAAYTAAISNTLTKIKV
jgi:hypothetical protein